MNTNERVKMVKAMEFIARQINNEDIFMTWLSVGVADQDIKYGDLSVGAEDDYIDYYYTDDERFADIMDTFLYIMARAKKNGGLYCDGVVSKAKTYD